MQVNNPVPDFIRDLSSLLRTGVRDENGIYIYHQVVEDMFITLGTPQNNKNKFYVIGRIQNVIRNYLEGRYNSFFDYMMMNQTNHEESSSLERYDIFRSTFRDLITSYDASYLNTGNVIVKLLNFLTQMYTNNDLFLALAGRYPFKIIMSIDTNLVVPTLVNNQAELKAQFIILFFRMLGSADFYTRSSGGGIDYDGPDYSEPDYVRQNTLRMRRNNDHEIIESDVESFALDRMRGSSISLLLIQYSQLAQGRMMPSVLKLPEKISRSVINPNNSDNFCMIYCLIIASKIFTDEKMYKAIKNKTSLNKLEAFPIIQATFDALYESFIELYENEEYITIDPDNIAELEKIFNININIYTFLKDDSDSVEIIHRSSFSNVSNSNIARLLYIPYSSMRPLKPTSNTRKYKLGSKTLEEYQEDINESNFFRYNDGHFCLLPQSSALVTGEKASDNYLCCPFCDTTHRGITTFEEHKKHCLEFQRSKSSLETKMMENPTGASQKFSKFYTASKSPFVIYGDTETQTDGEGHRLFSYTLYAKHYTDPSRDISFSSCAKKESDVGDGMIKDFMESLTLIRMHIRDNTNIFKDLDPVEAEDFLQANKKECCLFCKQVPFDKETKQENPELLIVHHDHNKPSPNIVGYLCRSCNTQEQKINKSFPLVFHNLPYDLLVLIKMLTVKSITFCEDSEKITGSLSNSSSLIANTTMKYSTLTLHAEKMLCQDSKLKTYKEWLPEIRFIDSCAFVQDSLESIVKNMASDSKDYKKTFSTTWKLLKGDYPEIAEELFQYSTEKGCIAYSHTNVNNMKSKTNLTQQQYKSDLDLTEVFYSQMKEKDPEQYNHLMVYKKKQEKILTQDYERWT